LLTLILSFFVDTSGQNFLLMLAFLFIPLSIILTLHRLVFYAASEFEYNKSLKYFL
jgi:hypothetical protein